MNALDAFLVWLRGEFAAIEEKARLAFGGAAALAHDTDHAHDPRAKVFRRELATGVDARLIAFLDWWEQNGTHDVTLAYPAANWEWVAPAGRRTDADQAKASATGQSNATTAAQSPHGHGAAIDLWPVDFKPNVKWELQPKSVRDQFDAQNDAAEKFGLVTGRHFTGPNFPNGDQPHIETPDWRQKAKVA